MQFIQDNCFFREPRGISSKGDSVKTPIPLSLTMESLLEAARKQRQLHLEHLPRSRKKKEKVEDATYQIEEDDMRAIYNRWRRDAESWMNPHFLMKYKQLLDSRKNAAAQPLGKKAFGTYLFQLSGS